MDKVIKCEKCGIELKGWRKCASCGATPDRGRPPVLDDNITMQYGDPVEPLYRASWLNGSKRVDDPGVWGDELSDTSLLTLERAMNANLQVRNKQLVSEVAYLKTELIAVPVFVGAIGVFLGMVIGWTFV